LKKLIRIQITAPGIESYSRNVDYIQVRDHQASARELVRLTRAAMEFAPVLVNDRADVAIACGAAGVHLRSRSVAPSLIKKLASTIVSVSCHSAEDVAAAEAEGADYALLAPIFPPLSKSDSRPPLGIAVLRRICSERRIPVIALGGITDENTALCVDAGAAGVAGITAFRR
jgi:thiamine-phosphate pyrophosphorylase